MANWDQESFAELVGRVQAHFEEASADRAKALDEGIPGRRERVLQLLDWAVNALALTPPGILSDSVATAIPQHVEAIRTHLAHWHENQNQTHLNEIHSHAENLADLLGRLPTPAADRTELLSAAASYRRSLAQRSSFISKKLKAQTRRAAALQEELEKTAEQQAAALSESESRATERIGAVDTKVQGVEAKLTEIDKRLDESIARYESQFSEAQAKRGELFTAALTDANEELGKITDTLEANAAKLLETWDKRASSMLSLIRQKHEDASELVRLISGSATSHGFGEEAKAQKKAADRLRGLALILVLCAGVLAFWTATHAAADPGIAQTLGRSLVTLVVLGAAGYAAGQSGHHRHREEEARRLELELIAFDPFIENLGDEDKLQARAELVTKIFGRGSPSGPDGKPAVVLNEDTVTLLGRLFEMFVRKG